MSTSVNEYRCKKVPTRLSQRIANVPLAKVMQVYIYLSRDASTDCTHVDTD
jgi:hypothetical protein